MKMNLPERTLRYLPLVCIAWAFTFMSVSAQHWQEFRVLNQNQQLTFDRTYFLYTNIVQAPDPSIGTVTLSTNGSNLKIIFTPVQGAEGTAEFIIEYFQYPPAPKIEAFRISVSSSFVMGVKDYYSVEENSVDNELNVIANDSIFGANTLNVAYVANVSGGSAGITADGQSILFTPEASFSGMAYLTYVVCNEYGKCGKGDVDICVIPAGGIPDNDTIYLSTKSKTPVTALLPVGGFEVTSAPIHGSAESTNGSTWIYTPFAGFTGSDAYVLQADNYSRRVEIDVYSSPAANTFVNADHIFTRIDQPVTFNVLANDVMQYPVSSFTQPAKGSLTNEGNGQFTYIPEAGYKGAQRFTYTSCFMAFCETGEVIVYVGDMIPENTFTYRLTTHMNVPLVLNYEIPLDGYAFVINAEPADGDLTLYSGEQMIPVACSEVSGYDLLVYAPEEGYTGSDYFEIIYCIDGGACHLVKVDVEVTDAGLGTMPCPCVDRCVWPGDADGNGQVNLLDLLNIGWQMGRTGPSREYPENARWIGQHADDWDHNLNGMNSKYADSDGNGVITSLDAAVVSQHYLRTHTLVPETFSLKADYPFDIIPLTPQVDSGDLAVFQISLGNELHPVIDLHGFFFSLNLPESLVDSASVNVTFHQNSWLGHDAGTLTLQKQPGNGRLDAAFTRTTGIPASGIGVVATLSFIVVDDIDGIKPPGARIPLRLGVNNAGSMESSGRTNDVSGTGAVIHLVTPGQNNDTSAPLEDQVFVFPNPSRGHDINIHVNGDRALQKIEILDLSGRLILSRHNLSGKQFAPDLSGVQNGLYVLRITTTDGVVTKKFEIFR